MKAAPTADVQRQREVLRDAIDKRPGTKLVKPLRDFAEVLRTHAIGLITAFDVFEVDTATNTVRLSKDADAIRERLGEKYQLVPLWLSFSTGIELLAKSVCIKHDVLIPDTDKGRVSRKTLDSKASNYGATNAPYQMVQMFFIDYSSDALTPFEIRCVKAKISHMFDINIGTLGSVYNKWLPKLHAIGVIDEDTMRCLRNALQVLADLRRNIDAHTFFGLTIGGSVNRDVEDVYIPAANRLLAL